MEMNSGWCTVSARTFLLRSSTWSKRCSCVIPNWLATTTLRNAFGKSSLASTFPSSLNALWTFSSSCDASWKDDCAAVRTPRRSAGSCASTADWSKSWYDGRCGRRNVSRDLNLRTKRWASPARTDGGLVKRFSVKQKAKSRKSPRTMDCMASRSKRLSGGFLGRLPLPDNASLGRLGFFLTPAHSLA